jgi:hypothetical protein
MSHCFVKLFIVIGFLFSFSTQAQLSYTGFEGIADETVFTRNTGVSSWVGQGFTVPWVNGFDVNRGYIDNAYAHSGSNSLRMFYPAGQFGTANTGGQAPLMVTPASQYYASYWFRFSDDFSFGTTSEGGKLPGLAGGGRCSGCATCTGANGFTARLMWRPGGRLVLYLYHLDKTNPPCGDNLTLQQGGSDYYAPRGQWIQIIERVKVNTGTNHDGEVELWVNEQPALLVTGIQFVSNGDQVDNLYFSTFHGGSTAAWAPVIDSYIWFDDIKISTNPSDVFSPLSISKDEQKASLDDKNTNGRVLFPNPLKRGTIVSLSNPDLGKPSRIEWLDGSGKTVWNNNTDNELVTLEIPDLKQGLYVVRFIFEDKVLTQKVVVD